jgi:anti-anti-sigma factor
MAQPRSDRPHAISFVESYLPDDRVLVKLIGELDATSLPGIERKLHELAESADTTIDLARTTFSDLSSVRMLVACRERARLHGHVLEAVNAPPHVERMLQMLERGHYWRPARAVRRDEGPEYTVPGPTTADAERSRPESEQIVRLQCPACGEQAFRPEHAAERACEKCGVELRVVAVFRDRRRRDAPVDHDRRQ